MADLNLPKTNAYIPKTSIGFLSCLGSGFSQYKLQKDPKSALNASKLEAQRPLVCQNSVKFIIESLGPLSLFLNQKLQMFH